MNWIDDKIAELEQHMQKSTPVLDKFERASLLNWLRTALEAAHQRGWNEAVDLTTKIQLEHGQHPISLIKVEPEGDA